MYWKEPLLHKNFKTSPLIQNITPHTQSILVKADMPHWVKSLGKAASLWREQNQIYKNSTREIFRAIWQKSVFWAEAAFEAKIAKLKPKEEHWRLTWKYLGWETQTKGRGAWNLSPFECPLPLSTCFVYRCNLIIIRQGSITVEMQTTNNSLIPWE